MSKLNLSFLLLLVLAVVSATARAFHAIHPLPHQAKHASPRALVQQQGQSLSRSSAVGPQQRASLMRREVVMIIPQVLFVAACAGGMYMCLVWEVGGGSLLHLCSVLIFPGPRTHPHSGLWLRRHTH